MRRTLLCLLIAASTAVAFAEVRSLGFLEFDDDLYVTRNAHVQGGLSASGIRWALTATRANNWHPVTWLSHMLDCQLFGLDPAWHHATSLGLHILNALALFLLLQHLTGAAWPSVFVAALFALHPLHVESVAWVSERKDLLSTLFGLLSLAAYAAWAQRGSRRGYALALGLFALSLMAKPMLVTLPVLMLLLDYWPLGRVAGRERLRRLLVEKLPFFVMSGLSSALTYAVQISGGSGYGGDALSPALRSANAVVSYARYLGKTFWPADLAALYPHPFVWPSAVVAGAAALVLGISALALWQARRRPYLLVGWLWYVVALLPVIGLVQVGRQAMADRYTYVPLVGIFVALAWLAAEAAERWRALRPALASGAVLVLLASGFATRAQVRHWENTLTLWGHALEVTSRNAFAHSQYGAGLAVRGDGEQALEHLRQAVALDPNLALAQFNLGRALYGLEDLEGAVLHYGRAVELEPGWSRAHHGLGVARARLGDLAGARDSLADAVRLAPDAADLRLALATVLEASGQLEAAASELSTLLESQPDHPLALKRLGIVLTHLERDAEARQALLRAAAHAPGDAELPLALAVLNARRGDAAGSIARYREALRLSPDHPLILQRLAWTLATSDDASVRDGAEALALAERLCRLSGCAQAPELDALAAAYAETGRFDLAVPTAERAQRRASEARAAELADAIAGRVELYRRGEPYRIRPRAGARSGAGQGWAGPGAAEGSP
jgi:tetratricopeptide (TPR) repeat protein